MINTAFDSVQVKVCDLVNSCDSPREEDIQMAVVGRELCIAPEVILRKPFTKPADVFSFGTFGSLCCVFIHHPLK